MSGIGTGYDLSTTTYSPDGKVFQVDYACKAVDNGGLALGIKCSDGVVLGVEALEVGVVLVPLLALALFCLEEYVRARL